uniref:Uncharacterized protein n=1 Tax=Arundo donax TaxID=35708 RepID=A0A0A9BAN1_ARUDO
MSICPMLVSYALFSSVSVEPKKLHISYPVSSFEKSLWQWYGQAIHQSSCVHIFLYRLSSRAAAAYGLPCLLRENFCLTSHHQCYCNVLGQLLVAEWLLISLMVHTAVKRKHGYIYPKQLQLRRHSFTIYSQASFV